eukprot:1162147-Pelagomonas_calceolata.AAC.19
MSEYFIHELYNEGLQANRLSSRLLSWSFRAFLSSLSDVRSSVQLDFMHLGRQLYFERVKDCAVMSSFLAWLKNAWDCAPCVSLHTGAVSSLSMQTFLNLLESQGKCASHKNAPNVPPPPCNI